MDICTLDIDGGADQEHPELIPEKGGQHNQHPDRNAKFCEQIAAVSMEPASTGTQKA